MDHEQGHGWGWQIVRAAGPELLVNALLPVIAYLVLRAVGVSVLIALVLSGVFPAAAVLVKFVRTRRIDRIGMLMLLVIVFGALVSLASGDPRFVLAKESLLTGGLGLVLLGSLFYRKPAMFYLWRTASLMKGPERGAAWDQRWSSSVTFRRSQRILTAGLGLLCLVEAVLRVWLTFVLPPAVMLVVSQLLPLAFLAVMFPWLMRSFLHGWPDTTESDWNSEGRIDINEPDSR